jgi:hypothetical protein
MRISFKCKTNGNQCAINTVKFILPNNITITIDRTRTEYEIEGDELSMTWYGCYLWAINGNSIFTDGAYITDASGFEDLVAGSKVEFELEEDAVGEDYAVECIEYSIGE